LAGVRSAFIGAILAILRLIGQLIVLIPGAPDLVRVVATAPPNLDL
jgi:hypothetical protein